MEGKPDGRRTRSEPPLWTQSGVRECSCRLAGGEVCVRRAIDMDPKRRCDPTGPVLDALLVRSTKQAGVRTDLINSAAR
jgi:hypothetical protein